MAENAPGPPGPVTVDVADVQGRQMVVGMAVAGSFGVVSVAAAVTGNVDGGTGVRVAAFLIGLVFSLIGVLPLLMWRAAFRRRRLVLDATGMRWDDPDGIPWAVRWSDLSEVAFSFPGPDTGAPGIPSTVHLAFRPADAGFRDEHPELNHLAAATGDASGDEAGVEYRLPFGHAQRVVGPIDGALSAFAPGLYRREGAEVPPPRPRPPAVAVSVGILGAYWASLMVIAVLRDGGDLKTLGMLAFWTTLVAVWLARIWAGGPLAVGRMAGFASTLGAVFLLGMLLLGVVLFESLRDESLTELWVFLPGLLTGAGLLVAGRLLARTDVGKWSETRGQGR
ncbi:hypothetical protein ACFHW2_41790 [Actinomadura sp. LOL_016]|uniref:hypothetical protein n=1 Tax=unclassified Actinomadura TaxID=2626254 RepID=UPI003A7FF902